MIAAAPTIPQRLQIIHDQIDRVAYQFDQAAVSFDAVDFRTKTWSRDSSAAFRNFEKILPTIRELYTLNTGDVAELPEGNMQRLAARRVQNGVYAINRYSNAIEGLYKVKRHDTSSTMMRTLVDTSSALLKEASQSLQDAADSVQELARS